MFFDAKAKLRATDERMFPGTRAFSFADPEDGRLETARGRLGAGGLELWIVRSTGHEIDLSEPVKASLVVPLRGRADVATRSGTYSAVAGDGLLFAPNVRRTRVAAAAGELYEAAVVLAPDGLLLGALGPDREALPPVEVALTASSVPSPDDTLRRTLLYLIEELSTPNAGLLAPTAEAHAEALLVDLLAGAFLRHARPTPAEERERAAGLGHVRRAEEIMRALGGEPLTMAELARRVGVSQRALQFAFRRHRGATPRAVLERFRLEEARRRLGTAGPEGRVSAIALELGFSHLGRFAIVYRNAFGETPSETLRRARGR